MPSLTEQLTAFYSASAAADAAGLTQAPPAMWQQRGEAAALATFRLAASRVPAYADFLRQQAVNPDTIATAADLAQVPPTTKENYLLAYPLAARCVDGRVDQANLISASSGSTGQPLYWPRALDQDVNVAKVLELMFRTHFAIDQRSTLMVMSFGLGIWTAGVYMLTASRLVAAKDYRMTLVTPGIDLAETVRALKDLGPLYEQTVLVGFPAFVKDVVDQLLADGIDVPALHLKVFTAGEVHTEPWRDYLLARAGIAGEYTDVTSVFASSEAGIIGLETPVSVYLRRTAAKDPKVFASFFGQDTLPSVVQYNPLARYLEVVDGELAVTSPGTLPLVRFNTRDRGQLQALPDVLAGLAAHGMDRAAVVHAIGAEPWTLPLAYVFGRANLTATIYGVNVYPESIKALLLEPRFHGKVTGRFAMRTTADTNQDQLLEFFVECGPGQGTDVLPAGELTRELVAHLKQVNSEFRKLSEAVTRPLVQVTLRPFHDPEFFVGQKQKFVLPTHHA